MAIPSDVSTAGSAAHIERSRNRMSDSIPVLDEERVTDVTHTDVEKQVQIHVEEMECDDEDLDQLIHELESVDQDVEEEEPSDAYGQTAVPEEMLQTDVRAGLTEPEAAQRRRKYGLNQMNEKRQNLFLKFLMYFVGPIQFVMEVRTIPTQPYGVLLTPI